jgi:hypothetical protein
MGRNRSEEACSAAEAELVSAFSVRLTTPEKVTPPQTRLTTDSIKTKRITFFPNILNLQRDHDRGSINEFGCT